MKKKREFIFQFSPEERKVFADGNYKVVVRIYTFLQDFIKKHDEEKVRGFYRQHEEFNDYLNTITYLTGEHSQRIKNIFTLSALISKHGKQKKNISADCFLYGLRRAEPEDIEDAQAILRAIDKETDMELAKTMLKEVDILLRGKLAIKGLSTKLKKRAYRARNTKYIADIYALAFELITF